MSLLRDITKDKKLLFFSGKGGVGKTTVAATCALGAAKQGKRTLLVSTDPAHNLGHLFNGHIGDTITSLTDNLFALELDPEKTATKHLDEVSQVLRRLMPGQLAGEIDKHMELAKHAPGLHEAALLERIAEVLETAESYDLIVFDTAPSGHTARLMALPELMSTWTDGLLKRRDKSEKLGKLLSGLGKKTEDKQGRSIFGSESSSPTAERDEQIRHILHRRKHRFAHLRNAIQDDSQCAFLIVLTLERLPVMESIELAQQLAATRTPLAGIVINKRIPSEATGLLAERRKQEDAYLTELEAFLGHLPQQVLPLNAQDITGLDALNKLAEEACR
ncbi:ArsA family ATPase [Aurantivibrio plasticivorans]